jgi:hypothetical protein
MIRKNLLLALTLFSFSLYPASQCIPSCEELLPENPIQNQQCPAAYNLPASIRVCHPCGWADGFFIEASYLYWFAGEDGLELGWNGIYFPADTPPFNVKTQILSQPFEYQSGFEIGAGLRNNDWVLSGTYTWIRNSTAQNSTAPLDESGLGGLGVWIVAPWFLQLAPDGGSLFGAQVQSNWCLRMDLADLSLSRPYYQGRTLTLLPYGGLRAAWIRQKMDVSLLLPAGLDTATPSTPIHSSTHSQCWAIGPRFGTEAHALLGSGFRLEGNLALSVLFTEYTKVYHSEDPAATNFIFPIPSIQRRNQTALRPVLETGLGLGWGGYCCSNRAHFDFSADYDFSLWWNQNVMRQLVNSIWNETPANGDLYLHGLTLTGRFDF